MILVRERRPEQGHDAVAHHLIDSSLVAMHRFHHSLKHRIEDLAGFFRIAISKEFHRALQIGEQDCDLLALALECALRREDLLGEVLRRVGVRRQGPARCAVRAEFGAAFAAELLFGGIGCAAGCAHSGQTRAALAAEFQGGGVFMLAARALHDFVLGPESGRDEASSAASLGQGVNFTHPQGAGVPDEPPSLARTVVPT